MSGSGTGSERPERPVRPGPEILFGQFNFGGFLLAQGLFHSFVTRIQAFPQVPAHMVLLLSGKSLPTLCSIGSSGVYSSSVRGMASLRTTIFLGRNIGSTV